MKTVRCLVTFLLLFGLLVQIGCDSSIEKTSARNNKDFQTFEDWAKVTAVPVTTTEPGGSYEDLMPLKKIIGNAPAVALGEPRHDIHDIFQFKHRMIEFLVKEMNFTAFVLELGFPAGKKIDDYINGGSGPLEEVDTGFNMFFGAYEEVLALVQWMRAYNDDPANARKLHFYGMDMPGAGTVVMSAVEGALNYLDTVDPEYADSVREVLLPAAEEFNPMKHKDLPAEDRDKLTASIELLVSRFENLRVVYIAKTSKDEYEWGYRHALSARQVNTNAITSTSGVSAEIGFNARERAMADNLRWIMDREKEQDGRTIIWGHNGHVQKYPIMGFFPNPPTTMGMYMKSFLGDDIFTIGSTFYKGTLKEVGPIKEEVIKEAKADSTESILMKVGQPMFILDLNNAPKTGPVHDWLSQEQEMRVNTLFVKTKLTEAFNALIYLEEVSRAHHTQGALQRLNSGK
ncbi:erythromycin esterase family protein [Acidobacteriota bacterium]